MFNWTIGTCFVCVIKCPKMGALVGKAKTLNTNPFQVDPYLKVFVIKEK